MLENGLWGVPDSAERGNSLLCLALKLGHFIVWQVEENAANPGLSVSVLTQNVVSQISGFPIRWPVGSWSNAIFNGIKRKVFFK